MHSFIHQLLIKQPFWNLETIVLVTIFRLELKNKQQQQHIAELKYSRIIYDLMFKGKNQVKYLTQNKWLKA